MTCLYTVNFVFARRKITRPVFLLQNTYVHLCNCSDDGLSLCIVDLHETFTPLLHETLLYVKLSPHCFMKLAFDCWKKFRPDLKWTSARRFRRPARRRRRFRPRFRTRPLSAQLSMTAETSSPAGRWPETRQYICTARMSRFRRVSGRLPAIDGPRPGFSWLASRGRVRKRGRKRRRRLAGRQKRRADVCSISSPYIYILLAIKLGELVSGNFPTICSAKAPNNKV